MCIHENNGHVCACLLRVLRLLSYLKGVHRIIRCLSSALSQLANMLALLLLFTVVAALMGMQVRHTCTYAYICIYI